MWIPSHVELESNELVNKHVRHVALYGAVFDRPLPLVEFQDLARKWQEKWDAVDTGKFAHW
jgi:hypothetical protein